MDTDPVSDAESISAWRAFLEEYAKGLIPDGACMPPLTEELYDLYQRSKIDPPPKESTMLNTVIYTSACIDDETARRVRQYYCENHTSLRLGQRRKNVDLGC